MIELSIRELSNLVSGTLILNKSNLDEIVKGVCIDSRTIEMNNLYVPLAGERVDGHIFIKDLESKGVSLIFCSDPSFLPEKVAVIQVEDTLVALQELARNYRNTLSCKVVGITGSNGKTSCKDILAGALSSKFKTQKTSGNKNNEIGVPLTLLSLDKDVEVAVIEMGMENREEIHFLNSIVNQDIAIITNVGIAHLENLGSIENIGKAKLEIIDDLKVGSLFIYCGDDFVLKQLMKNKKINQGIKVNKFGNDIDNDIYLKCLSQNENGIYFSSNLSDYEFHIDILGKHQATNALAVIACARYLGLSDKEIQAGFQQMEKTSMRNELLKIGNAIILNDAYKSNPQSAIAALETFAAFTCDYKICVLGDMLELGNTSANLHYELGERLEKYDLQEILCVGEMAKYIGEGALKSYHRSVVKLFDDCESLFEYIKDNVHKDCMILFKGSRGMALDLVIDKLKEYGE